VPVGPGDVSRFYADPRITAFAHDPNRNLGSGVPAIPYLAVEIREARNLSIPDIRDHIALFHDV
jgi:hypothetical protein